ncbi:alpha-tubulin N-acetyltransferase 2-like isoform X3 [Oratosquilla oratoria]|uniref:alpha-tubulin N-acetyltransferase 2-like isoform X3 n=1 Tax=Oratosquilla oratoria TaxID=337810 RepID=UPI003F75E7AF
MEFKFDVNVILQDEITKVDNTLILRGWQSKTRNRVEYQQLYEIINAIGEISSFAQGLNNIITNADKLQNSDHLLYLMKECDDKDGHAVVVGMLKIGRKKLFLLDPSEQTKEVAPFCVLDFYIHESRQRRGYGRRLFEYMLQDQNVLPGHMAVDKPSDKFLGFLCKHYGLVRQVPQINNFVVFDAFFGERPVATEEAAMTFVSRSPRSISPDRNSSPGGSRRSSTASTSQSHYAGRPSRTPGSSMADILHGRADRHSATARLAPRYQNTLDVTSPPAQTPPRSSFSSRKASVEQVDGERSYEGSVIPTPASSPKRESPSQEDQANGRHDEDQEVDEELLEKVDSVKISASPGLSPTKNGPFCGLTNICKTGNWRDSVSRSSVGLSEHMASQHGSRAGVLQENESVHGHLKFHHHALW